MKKLLAAAATVFTLALASPALAGYQSPTFVSSTGTLALVTFNPNGQEFRESGDALTAKVTGITINSGDSGTMTFTIPDDWRGDQTLVIYAPVLSTGAGGSWSIGATYSDDSVGTATVAAFPITSGGAIRIPTASFTQAGGYLTGSRLLTGLTITYTYTGASVTGDIAFDLVANPEPGSIALFGLGSLALGGFAWRRRKARKAAAAASV